MFLSFEHEFHLAAIDQCLAWHDKKAKDEQFIVLGFMTAETRRQLPLIGDRVACMLTVM